MNDKEFNIRNMNTFNRLRDAVDSSRFHYLHNYLKRITRKYKFHTPHSKETNCILLDQEMYDIIENEEGTFFSFGSGTVGKRFKIKLKSRYCYSKTGNIQLVLNRDKRCLEIHKLIECRTKENIGNAVIGIDKGYSTLLSCSDGEEYGIDMGDAFTAFSDFINTRNTNRNYFIQGHKNLVHKLSKIESSLKVENDGIKRCQMMIERADLKKQIAHIEEHHLGNKLYKRQHKRMVAELEGKTNFYIKQMFKESDVHSFSKEDLSFTKTGNKGKKCNRILNTWLKGTLNERMEYLASYYNISFVDVNPAYTSQYCHKCHAKIERRGQHHEIAICPNCGELNANVNAAENILDRMNDNQITLRMPYKKVKEILEQRYK